DADDPEAVGPRGLDLPARQSPLGPDKKMHARAQGEGGGEARGEGRSEQASLPPALPLGGRAFPQAEPELGGLAERQQLGERPTPRTVPVTASATSSRRTVKSWPAPSAAMTVSPGLRRSTRAR